jgi:ABC-2 type transport system permease protein
VNWNHLTTMLWLRGRLSLNQWRRAGVFNLVVMILIASSASALAVSSFFVTLGGGLILLPKVTDFQFLLIWDALVILFLVVWSISLIVEVQRSEMLSLDKFTHLPMSLKGAFFLNYLTSFISLGLVFFTSASLGLTIAAIAIFGWSMLLLFPTVLAFIAMITALTYQVRGWLVSLMSTKRRMQTVVTMLTLGIVLVTQIPNVLFQVGMSRPQKDPPKSSNSINELATRLEAKQIDEETFNREMGKILADEAIKRKLEKDEEFRRMEKYVVPGNLYLPIGWLPLASRHLVHDRLWPSGLAIVGMLSLAGASLWRSYSVTLRQSMQSGGRVRQPALTKSTLQAKMPTASLLGRELPLVDEPTATVVLASWIHLIRSPEAKLALIGPIIVLVFLFIIAATKPLKQLPAEASGFVLLGGIAFVMFVHLIMSLNIFGTDRSAFRAYVLMPIERRYILVGKNLALVPVLLMMAMVVFGASIYFAVPTWPVFLASLLQLVVVFCGASLLGNVTSIYSPMAIVPGTAQPANISFTAIVIQFTATLFFPIALLPAAAAMGGEIALAHFANIRTVPIYLILSLVEALLCIWLYRRLIGWQGRLLQSRETRILEVVNSYPE